MGAGQVSGRAMAGPESETQRRDWRQAVEEDVMGVGEGDERPGKEQRGTAAGGSFIPIESWRRGRGEGRRRRRRRKGKRRGGRETWEDWRTSEW